MQFNLTGQLAQPLSLMLQRLAEEANYGFLNQQPKQAIHAIHYSNYKNYHTIPMLKSVLVYFDTPQDFTVVTDHWRGSYATSFCIQPAQISSSVSNSIKKSPVLGKGHFWHLSATLQITYLDDVSRGPISQILPQCAHHCRTRIELQLQKQIDARKLLFQPQ